jgi:hypothetical protein
MDPQPWLKLGAFTTHNIGRFIDITTVHPDEYISILGRHTSLLTFESLKVSSTSLIFS